MIARTITGYARGYAAPLRRGPTLLRGLHGLGAQPGEAEADWWNVAAQFREANRLLLKLEAQFRADPQGSGIDGKALINARDEYTRLAAAYQLIWQTAFGSPAQLEGMGAWQIPVAIIAAGKFALIAAAIAALLAILYRLSAAADAAQQARASAAATQNTAVTMWQQYQAKADAATDPAERARWQQLADQWREFAQGGAGTDFSAWFQNNWMLVAGAVALITIGPKLLGR